MILTTYIKLHSKLEHCVIARQKAVAISEAYPQQPNRDLLHGVYPDENRDEPQILC